MCFFVPHITLTTCLTLWRPKKKNAAHITSTAPVPPQPKNRRSPQGQYTHNRHTHTPTCTCTHTHTHAQRERERERRTQTRTHTLTHSVAPFQKRPEQWLKITKQTSVCVLYAFHSYKYPKLTHSLTNTDWTHLLTCKMGFYVLHYVYYII
jgi:hypothetical protein